ncbi:MAG: tetratricopeptide repeat protein [Rhodospirillales bacterium]
MREADLLDDARDALLRATELDLSSATAHLNLANVLRAQGNATAALGSFECAEACQPGDAVAAFDAAININPDCADAHWNRAIDLLV